MQNVLIGALVFAFATLVALFPAVLFLSRRFLRARIERKEKDRRI